MNQTAKKFVLILCGLVLSLVTAINIRDYWCDLYANKKLRRPRTQTIEILGLYDAVFLEVHPAYKMKLSLQDLHAELMQRLSRPNWANESLSLIHI